MNFDIADSRQHQIADKQLGQLLYDFILLAKVARKFGQSLCLFKMKLLFEL